MNVLECCRHHSVQHLAYASSTCVYGGNAAVQYSVHASVEHPISLYAATKRSNELMAHSCSYLFGLPTTGLRFFTFYGPWGRAALPGPRRLLAGPQALLPVCHR